MRYEEYNIITGRVTERRCDRLQIGFKGVRLPPRPPIINLLLGVWEFRECVGLGVWEIPAKNKYLEIFNNEAKYLFIF